MQVREKVRRPRNRIRFARSGRMLNQILGADPFGQNGLLQFAGRIELMVPGKQDFFDLLLVVLLGDQVTAENFQPALPFPDFFP